MSGAVASADAYADRLRSDPLLSQLLHQILSGITAVRSSAEILEDVPDLDEAERQRFLGAIGRETRALGDVARNLIGQFETSSRSRSSRVAGARDRRSDHRAVRTIFRRSKRAADELAAGAGRAGPFGVATLTEALERRFGVTVADRWRASQMARTFPGSTAI